ncbi:tetrahydrofolate dehydrogenase/cyclohydrolase catalytic domain-containing protein [Buchnera aphidicola]|uniref:bifunctional 5,10-methylenetetrahydrofolate dehydrogenase/5,10-methenyltetrahydrofolate cyclohydrolase n=1 Tax=Buchnera aphidicola TaxID=9 RepID=UPI0030EEC5E8
MKFKIMNGKKIAQKMQKKIKKIVLKRKIKKLSIPGLAIILIGNDCASKIYVKNKIIACKKVGFKLKIFYLKENILELKILKILKKLNKNPKIHGILLQLPIPKNLNLIKLIKKISFKKDVDGLNYNYKKLFFQKKKYFESCTVLGIMHLLKKYKINLKKLNILIIGNSNLIGKPMALKLLSYGYTVTITNKFTKNLKSYLKIAQVIIIAIGKPNFLNKKYLRKGVIIIDVGINFIKNKIIGDVNFKSVQSKSSYITPVPGGVGPMTITFLLKNTLNSCIKNI